MHQLDLKSAFLNGLLEEEVYVCQPSGFKVKDQKNKMYKLKKLLCGLKQTPRAQNKWIGTFLLDKKFTKCRNEHGVYVKKLATRNHLLVCLYVDDLLVTRSSQAKIDEFKRGMKSELLGLVSYFLDMEFVRTNKGMFLHQKKHVDDILRRFNMVNFKLVTTPVDFGINLEKDGNESEVDATLQSDCQIIKVSFQYKA